MTEDNINIPKQVLFDLEDYITQMWSFMPTPMALVSPWGKILEVDGALERLLGCTRDELIGKDVLELYSDKEEAALIHEKTLRREPVVNYEGCTLTDARGEVIPISLSTMVRIDNLTGDSIGYFAAFVDIRKRKKIEEALEKSTAYLRSLLNSMEDLVFVINLDGIFSEYLQPVNNNLYVLPSEFIGKHFGDVLPEYLAELIQDAINQVENTGKTQQFDYSLMIKGKNTWYNATISPIRDDQGTLRGFIAVSRDITEHKKSREVLEATERNFRNSLDDSPLGIRISGGRGELLYANRALLDIYGCGSIEELNNKKLREFITEEGWALHQKLVKNWKRGENSPPVWETSIVRQDGEVRHMQVHRKEVIWDGKHRFQTICQDITEAKNAREAVQAAEQNFRTSLEESPLGIRINNDRGELYYANKAMLDIFGFDSVEELLAVPIKQRITADSYAAHQERVKMRRKGVSFPESYEIDIVNTDGGVRNLAVLSKSVIWNGETQLQSIFQDVTERKKNAEEINNLYKHEKNLRKKLEMEISKRIEFTNLLVHELKTPITPVLSSSELLMEELKDDPLFSLAENINRGASNMNRRIDELLDLARNEVGKLSIKPKPVEPLPLFCDIARNMMPLTFRKRHTLSLELPDTLSCIRADEDRLRQVMLNLIQNAFKFTPKGGKITLRAREDTTGLTVEVEDTGRGISRQESEDIFEIYRQKRGRNTGLGVGLALSKRLIELHGGNIWVESEKGKGSTFCFTIPLSTETKKGIPLKRVQKA